MSTQVARYVPELNFHEIGDQLRRHSGFRVAQSGLLFHPAFSFRALRKSALGCSGAMQLASAMTANQRCRPIRFSDLDIIYSRDVMCVLF
jgi:hypothetical protein